MAHRTVRGFAWMVFPEADPPGDPTEPGLPFERGTRPPGVVDFWPVVTEFGLQDERSGTTYLVLTEAATPPPLPPSYAADPARLRAGDALGGGLARVVRVLGSHPAGREAVPECEVETEDETILDAGERPGAV